MSVADFLVRWSADAYRHIPAGSSFDVLDFRFAGRGLDNRWNYPGQPTLYLAGDVGVALGELARHFEEDRTPTLKSQLAARQLYRLHVEVDRLLDLRDARVLEALSIEDAPRCFLDRAIARATAHFIRTVTLAPALLVPSTAFLDRPDRWVGVLFLEKLSADPRHFITSVVRDRSFRLELVDQGETGDLDPARRDPGYHASPADGGDV